MTLQPDPPDESDLTSVSTNAPTSGSDAPQGFGPYRFLQRLGEGGMGEVWLAEQLRPVRRHVAIKVVKAGMDTAQVVARFEAERQALAVMDHPAIAKVFDGGTTPEGRPYFAMEYVRGESITSYCNRQRLPVRERLELFIQLCDGVQHAHQKGVIHRDLKPSSVLVSISDDHPVPRIIDFGIANAVAQPLTERSLFTELGGFLGTPEYMSPEQAELSPVDVDTRSDLYSLGVVLYELLVGTLPFDSEVLRRSGVDDIRRMIREKDPPRPSTRVTHGGSDLTSAAEQRRIQPARLASLLRGDLDWITMKAREKDRPRRYQTANALALDVRRHLNHEPVSAGSPSVLYRTRKFVRRRRAAVAAGATLVALLAVFAVVTAAQAGRIARERDRANQEAAAAKQVSDFLVGLFEVSDPSEARGSTLTARELLDTGAKDIEVTLRDQPEVQARLQETIGLVYTGLGLYVQAQPLLQRAADTYRRLLGQDHPEAIKAAHALANLYWYQGKYQEAEPVYLDVAQRRRRVLGDEHPDTLRVNFDLASLYFSEKRLDLMEPLAVRTLDIQQRVLGPEHPDTLSSMNNIQSMYVSQRRYSEAESIGNKVLDIRRRTLGEDHPLALISLHNLAAVYNNLGRYTEAEKLYLQAISARSRVLGENHPGSGLYEAWGKAQEAAAWRAKLPDDRSSQR